MGMEFRKMRVEKIGKVTYVLETCEDGNRGRRDGAGRVRGSGRVCGSGGRAGVGFGVGLGGELLLLVSYVSISNVRGLTWYSRSILALRL